MIYYIEKLDITEEKVRLQNHCKYFREVARGEEAPGRKLGFIAQELAARSTRSGRKPTKPRSRKGRRNEGRTRKIKEQVLNIPVTLAPQSRLRPVCSKTGIVSRLKNDGSQAGIDIQPGRIRVFAGLAA